MAAAAAAAAVGAFLSFQVSSSIFFKSGSFAPCRNLRTRLPLVAIRASSSSPSPSPTPPPAEFNITFGVAPKGVALKPEDSPAAPLFIPWIVRDENGNLKLQSTPPAYLLQAMAHAKTTSAKKKKKDKAKAVAASASAEPKHSKAARRFYNENFREPQRLSKVLAAAGGA